MSSRNLTGDTKESAERVGRDLRAELAVLSAEVEKLADEIGRRSRAGGRSARSGAARGLAALNSGREDVVEEIGRGLSHVAERAGSELRERPVRSLGLALLAGFLLAFLWRR